MVVAAATHPDAGPVLRASGSELPIASGAVDLVVAFMSPQDMDDPASFMIEAARVLDPGGRLHLAIVHPINSGGSFESTNDELRFVLPGSYFDVRRRADPVERDGLSMRFVSEHRPLEQYSRWLERAGFVIERLRELPEPDDRKWANMPLFAHVTATKPPLDRPADRRLFHITNRADADRLIERGELSPPSLESEGFVHCSTAAQVIASTARHFEPGADLVLVELDPELVEADVKWPEVYPGERFPHLQGPLQVESVVAVHPWGPTDRVRWAAASRT